MMGHQDLTLSIQGLQPLGARDEVTLFNLVRICFKKAASSNHGTIYTSHGYVYGFHNLSSTHHVPFALIFITIL